MKLVNTHISQDCIRKALVYVDRNGHYELERYVTYQDAKFPVRARNGRSHFKHIESCNRAVAKWVGK